MQTEHYILGLEHKLHEIVGSIHFVLPEICIALCLFLVIIIDLFNFRKKYLVGISLSLGGFAMAFLLLAMQWQQVTAAGPQSIFLGMLVVNHLAVFLKMLFVTGGILTVVLSFKYSIDGEKPIRHGEYHTLIYGVVLGAMLLAMSRNLLMIYLSIELISITSYILTNFNFGKKSAEASLKYLLFGAVSSGIMLYGMSLLYGFTGTLDLGSSQFVANLSQLPSWPYLMAIFMTLAGFLFKLGAIPFHIWAPDVYEGAPTPIVALFSTVPKIAGVIVLFLFLGSISAVEVSISISPSNALALIAILTMLVGNLSALWQSNARRMMAYSSIAHAGFMLSGVVAHSKFGLDSLLFYATVLLLMNFAAFLIIKLLNQQGGDERIQDFSGWGKKAPYVGVATIIVMISLTGIPPTAGFTAKLLIFSAVWEAYQTTSDPILLTLFGVGLLNTVLALFYYIKIPYYMFFHSSIGKNKVILQDDEIVSTQDKYLLGILIFPLLILFFKSDWLTNIFTIISFEF